MIQNWKKNYFLSFLKTCILLEHLSQEIQFLKIISNKLILEFMILKKFRKMSKNSKILQINFWKIQPSKPFRLSSTEESLMMILTSNLSTKRKFSTTLLFSTRKKTTSTLTTFSSTITEYSQTKFLCSSSFNSINKEEKKTLTKPWKTLKMYIWMFITWTKYSSATLIWWIVRSGTSGGDLWERWTTYSTQLVM